jgi:[ribosomal protein S5]-alanine N-acetyltransferase
MEFTYDKFYLRKAVDEDAKDLYAICMDEAVMAYYGEAGFDVSSFDDVYKEIAWFNEQFEKNAGRWVISVKGEDAYVGDIGFFNFVKEHNRVEIGYKLQKKYWGSGVISEFLRLLLRHGFNDLRYNRVEAEVDSRNIGSRKVLLKNGFRHEGTFREFERKNGAYIDLEMFAILKKDYSLGI